MQLNVFLIYELILLITPMLILLVSLIPVSYPNKLSILLWGQLSNFILSVLGLLIYFTQPVNQNFYLINNFFKIDFVAVCLLMIIAFISTSVIFFSERYLCGDSSRLSFIRNLLTLSLFASIITVSNNLILSLIAWTFISLTLWGILRLKEESKQAAQIVLYHHLFSDLLLLIAIISIVSLTNTSNIAELPNHLNQVNGFIILFGHKLAIKLTSIICLLIILAMSIKSALFPFHHWLIATLEAPTPLSGLLHAGIVNISAILAMRLFPVLATAPTVLMLWAAIAFFSAIIGTLIMSTQNDVKRKLVYSTVGQMGFMSLQCATGFLPAAIFHLIAHGLFKCHMFLQSGSAVCEGLSNKHWLHAENLPKYAAVKLTIGLIAFILLALVLIHYLWPVASINSQTGLLMLLASVAILSTLPALKKTSISMLFGFNSILLVIASISVLLACKFDSLVSFSPQPSEIIMAILLASFIVIDIVLHTIARSNFTKALYVHALNGFYISNIARVLNNKSKINLAKNNLLRRI